MEFEYSKKDLKKSPKSKSIEVYYDRGFWRFDGASAGYATEEIAKEEAEKYLARKDWYLSELR